MTEIWTAEQYQAHTRGARNKAQGERTERLTKQALEANGVGMVERIETGFGIVRRGKRIVSAYPKARVSGDFRGVLNGRSVLCEAKHREGRLQYSALEQHQREALTAHAELGGLSLVAWDTGEDLFLMQWPIEGFGPRKSMTAEIAAAVQWIGE